MTDRSTGRGWRDDLARWPAFAPHFRLDPARAALLIVDMQNGYVRAEYGMGQYLREQYPDLARYYFDRQARVVVPNIVRLLDRFRQARRPVLHVTFGAHRSDASDWLPSRRRVDEAIERTTRHKTAVLVLGTPEHAIIDELAPRPDEIVVNKVTRGAFNSTGIDQVLRNMGAQYLVVVGCITNVCVETTARDAVDHGYDVVVVDDGTASFNPEFHDASLRAFAATFGMVSETEDVLKKLSEVHV
jgi:nicotinamidase-related amidase